MTCQPLLENFRITIEKLLKFYVAFQKLLKSHEKVDIATKKQQKN